MIKNKYFLIFFLVAFFSLSGNNFCLSRILEVDYPSLPIPGTPAITTTTPLPEYLIYMFNLGMVIGFLAVFISLIIGGFLYIISAGRPEVLKNAKVRVFAAIAGLVLLLTTYLIITTINPQLGFFRAEPLPDLGEWPTPEFIETGVFLYETENCSSDPVRYLLSSELKIGERIRSVKIVNDPDFGIYYIAILYDHWNYKGKCQFLNPITGCINIKFPASSISVYRFDYSLTGNGITFYRKAFFNENLPPDRQREGVFTVEHSNLSPRGYYFVYLNNLRFENRKRECNIPVEEQDCLAWDLEGKCIQRRCPTLAGENISSIKINGDYFVLLLHYDAKTKEWSTCQAFPAPDDINKEGPEQIKWEYIRRDPLGKLPNAVLIFPVASK